MAGDLIERSGTNTNTGPQGLTLEKPAAPQEQAPQSEPQAQQTSFEAPDRFRDKPVEDVIKSYVELEKEKGRLAQILGTNAHMVKQITPERQLAKEHYSKRHSGKVGG